MNIELKLYNEPLEILSSGICDNCINSQFKNVGDEDDPYEEIVCVVKKFIIQPVPEEDRIKKCESYA